MLVSNCSLRFFDATSVLQIVVGLAEPAPSHLVRSDLIRDGSINVLDAVSILQHVVGLAQISGCGPPTAYDGATGQTL